MKMLKERLGDEETCVQVDDRCERVRVAFEDVGDAFEVIGSFLDASSLLSCACVSTKWRKLFDRTKHWKTLCLQSRPDHIRITKEHLQLAKPWDTSLWKKLYQALVTSKSMYDRFSIAEQGIYESSRDHPTQSIACTLEADPTSFWSSTGSSSALADDVQDVLVYRLQNGICVITSLSIVPFRAAFQAGTPTYAPQRLRVIIQMNQDIDSAVFTSDWFNVYNRNEVQTFRFGDRLIYGGYVRIEMEGRYQTQPIDSLYYSCLEMVCILGVPAGVLQNHALDTLIFEDYSRYQSKIRAPAMTFPEFQTWLRRDIEQLLEQSIQNDIARDRLLRLVSSSDLSGVASAVAEIWLHDNGDVDLDSLRVEVLRTLQNDFPDEEVVSYLVDLCDSRNVPLNEEETMALAVFYAKQKRPNQLDVLMATPMIQRSERLGDMFYELGQFHSALSVYAHANILDKVLLTFARTCSKEMTLQPLLSMTATSDDRVFMARRVAEVLRDFQHPFLLARFAELAMDASMVTLEVAEDMLSQNIYIDRTVPLYKRVRTLREYCSEQRRLYDEAATSEGADDSSNDP